MWKAFLSGLGKVDFIKLEYHPEVKFHPFIVCKMKHSNRFNTLIENINLT